MDLKLKSVSEDPVARGILKDRDFPDYWNEYVLVGEEETVLAKSYKDYAKRIDQFEFRKDDTLICTYPKVGTTWAQEMVWLIGSNLNYQEAQVSLHARSPILEACIQKSLPSIKKVLPTVTFNLVEYLGNCPSPRFIKTHLPFYLLPESVKNHSKKPRMVYVLRNPKDVCVSYYHHCKAVNEWNIDFNSFCELFLAGRVDYGSYFKHVLSYWERRNDFNILFLVYEEMKKDLQAVVKRVAHFLDKEVPEQAVAQLCEHLSFDSMRKNQAMDPEGLVSAKKEMNLIPQDAAFFRSGVAGKFKEEMSPEIIKKFDEWTKSHIEGSKFECKFGDYMY